MNPQDPDVSVVVVSYNVADLLHRCLLTIRDQTSCAYEVIVVDNNSQDETVEMLRNAYPEVRLTVNGENRGFATANNQAFEFAKGRYVLMLNPDTLVLDHAIDKLVHFMDSRPECGACGPKILNSDHSLQLSCHHFPTLSMRLVEHSGLGRRFAGSEWFGKEFMTYWKYDDIREIDWITGCALMIRKDALRRVGGLDEGYFMYAEEMDLCFRLRRSGCKVMFFPQAEIVHFRGASTETLKGGNAASAPLERLLRSRYYFFRKNYGWTQCLCVQAIDLLYFLAVLLKNLVRRDADAKRRRLALAKAGFSAVFQSEPVRTRASLHTNF